MLMSKYFHESNINLGEPCILQRMNLNKEEIVRANFQRRNLISELNKSMLYLPNYYVSASAIFYEP